MSKRQYAIRRQKAIDEDRLEEFDKEEEEREAQLTESLGKRAEKAAEKARKKEREKAIKAQRKLKEESQLVSEPSEDEEEDEEATKEEELEERVKESVSLYEFIGVINTTITHDEKIELIESLWKLIYKDEKLNQYEDHLIKRIAATINIEHKQIIDAKLWVKQQMGLK